MTAGSSTWRSSVAAAAIAATATSPFASSPVLLHRLLVPAAAVVAAATHHPAAAEARNLPTSNGASGAQRGQPASLAPVLKMQRAVVAAAAAARAGDVAACGAALRSFPGSETDFKKAFDEHSEGISYKQEFLDKNAFLVYYTQGFDGPGRPSIEQDDPATAKEKAQFGARNDAWVAVDEVRCICTPTPISCLVAPFITPLFPAQARSEVQYLQENTADTDTRDLTKALAAAEKAFADYVALDTPDVVQAAKALL